MFAECRLYFDNGMLIEITHQTGLYVDAAMLTALIRPAFDADMSAEPDLASSPAS